MHENKFENEVREKMDQLGFDPPDAVWANVDKEINKEKKDRQPLFWIFFLSGLMLAGGIYYFSTNKNSIATHPNNQDLVSGKATGKKTDSRGQADGSLRPKVLVSGNHPADQLNTISSKKKSDNSHIARQKTGEAHQHIVNRDITINQSDSQKAEITSTAKTIETSVDSPAQKVNLIAGKKSSLKDSASDNNVIRTAEKKSQTSKWKFGFTAGAGISNSNQSLFKSGNSYYTFAAASPPGSGSGNPASVSINSGFSFSAAVLLNRILSKRIYLSGGLGYHYYSTKMQIGNPAYGNPVTAGNGAMFAYSSGYYQNGDSHAYINQYHFIELPVSIDFQLNKNNRLPLIWEAGLSLLYLLNSNAVQYDPAYNVYYKNNQLFNRTQLNMTTALLIGFHINKTELQAGPQLQYGLTSLLKTAAANPQHLLYYGLKISVLPWKK
jgi:hypothetical protein